MTTAVQQPAGRFEEIRDKALLRGFRGRPAVNEEAFRTTLLRVSALLRLRPEVEEIDFTR